MRARLHRLRVAWRSFRFKRADPYRRADLLRERGATVGKGCRIHTTSLGTEPYLITIGDETVIAYGVSFITHDGSTWVFRKEHPLSGRFGRITLGSRAFVGANAILMPGVTIGDRAIVAAGAVVTKDVAAGTIVGGVPAEVIGTTDEFMRRTLERYPLLEPPPPGRARTAEELRRQLEERYPAG
jgi:acetyltransferase-like isoleucine patch superfamily enzyme